MIPMSQQSTEKLYRSMVGEILHQGKVPIATEVVPAPHSEYHHMDRTGHRQFFQERIKGYGLVVTCAVCGEQVQARFAKLARWSMDVDKMYVNEGWHK